MGVLGQSDLPQRAVLLFAEDDAYSRGFILHLHGAVKVVDIHLHLPQVLMGQLPDLEVDQHIGAKQAVVEDEVHKKMVLVESESFLAGSEEKSFPELQQKVFEFVDDGGFQVGFGIQ